MSGARDEHEKTSAESACYSSLFTSSFDFKQVASGSDDARTAPAPKRLAIVSQTCLPELASDDDSTFRPQLCFDARHGAYQMKLSRGLLLVA